MSETSRLRGAASLWGLRGVQAVLARTSLRRTPVARWIVAALAFVLAFAIRYWLDEVLPAGFPFLTFFPAVIITTFFAGLVPGVVVAVLSGVSAWFFIAPTGSFPLNWGAALALAFYVFIVVIDISLIHWMQQALERLETEKATAARHAGERDVLFAELQHRVSNNLSVVSALLNAQARAAVPEAASALSQASARIALISKIQRELHHPSRQSLDLGPYLAQLGPDLVEAAGAGGAIAYRTHCDPVTVPAALAVPLGLIATELISNSIEHGFKDGRRGTIHVSLRFDGERPASGAGDRSVLLRVADDGTGWPDGFEPRRSRDLGLRIVSSLANQIGASFEIANEGGAVSRLRFALPASAG